jgi:flagellar biosynthesis anti-sigma factor FlgM
MKNCDITKCSNQQSVIEPYRPDASGDISLRRNQAAFKNDTVTCISSRAREMQIAWKAAKSAPDIRYDKVESIKRQVMEGRYQIHADQVAEKLCDSHSDGSVDR